MGKKIGGFAVLVAIAMLSGCGSADSPAGGKNNLNSGIPSGSQVCYSWTYYFFGTYPSTSGYCWASSTTNSCVTQQYWCGEIHYVEMEPGQSNTCTDSSPSC